MLSFQSDQQAAEITPSHTPSWIPKPVTPQPLSACSLPSGESGKAAAEPQSAGFCTTDWGVAMGVQMVLGKMNLVIYSPTHPRFPC